MVLHGLKRIFQKPTPNLSSSERTNQLRSKTIYAGTVELSTALKTPGSTRYKTYNGPFEIVDDNGNGSLIASASYKDLLDITKGKVLLNQLPLTSLTASYYKKNFGNGEMYVGNYQEFNGSFFSGDTDTTRCKDSVLVYDITTTGFTGRHSYTENSIGNTEPTGLAGSDENIFIDPKHCYYSEQCASSNSYMKIVDINLKGANGPSQYYSQQIINSNQYSGFSFPMSNFSLTCVQQNPLQTEGPLFCPLQPPSLSVFSVPHKVYNSIDFQITPPQSNSLGSFTYSSSNISVATISGPNFDMITIIGSGTSTITAFQSASGGYSSGSISTLFYVTPATFTTSWHYTNDGGATFTDITLSQQILYDDSNDDPIYVTISVKETFPANATYTQSGTASVTNDGTAQLTITGSGNFVGSLTSPSITIIPEIFTTSWHYTNDGGKTFTDITLSKQFPYDDSRRYTKSLIPANAATYTQSGTCLIGTRKTFSYYVSRLKESKSKLKDIAVNPISPTFTDSFFIPSSVNYSLIPFSFHIIPPTSNSGGAFSYAVSPNNPSVTFDDINVVTFDGINVATFDGTSVTINADVGVGTYTITAFQEADGNFTSRSVTASFNVVAMKS